MTDIAPKAVPVSSVQLSESQVFMNEAEGRYLNATVYPSNATNKDITWSSSNPSVAEVDFTGYVFANKSGQTTITACTVDGNKVATAKVIVKQDGQKFIDVGASHRFINEINYLTAGQIIFVYNEYTFGPNDKVSRAAAATMIGRALGLVGTQR
jgi:uncharacterized protein YjdB